MAELSIYDPLRIVADYVESSTFPVSPTKAATKMAELKTKYNITGPRQIDRVSKNFSFVFFNFI